MSKALATIATQPLIVAKVGLQSKPPKSRNGKPFKSFGEVMKFIVDNEGPLGLFKGIGPQIFKGLIVQGILMMTKERFVYYLPRSPPYFNSVYILTTGFRMELLFILLFRYIKSLRTRRLDAAEGVVLKKVIS